MPLPVKSVLFSVFEKYLVQQVRFYSLIKMTTQAKWKIEKNKMLTMPLEEKRKLYKTADYIILDRIDPWCKFVIRNKDIEMLKHNLDDLNEFRKIQLDASKDKELSEKVSIFQGDITKLEIDAIVNAANSKLIAGGGVDGAIHRAAGPFLQEECNSLHGCATGDAKVTGGYNLPAKYVIHTVGPRDGSVKDLQSCYDKSLSFHHEYKIKSIAFPCIATGIYGFPNRLAAHIALRTARKFLEANDDMERIIFCTFMPVDVDIYKTLLQMYFPLHDVIHTVGPRDGSVKDLQSCYDKSLSFHHEYKIKSIAFPCIATGIYGFPNRLAAHIALRTARKFLEANDGMERIIFCTFMPVDVDIYKTLLQMYFPLHGWNYNDGASVSE